MVSLTPSLDNRNTGPSFPRVRNHKTQPKLHAFAAPLGTGVVRGGFLFDFFTSIPVAFAEYFLIQQCADLSAPDGGGSDGVLRIMRTSKALRVARLIRAFKIIARLRTIAGFMGFLAAYLRIPGYILRVLQVGFLLGMLIHLCSCAFWLIKV